MSLGNVGYRTDLAVDASRQAWAGDAPRPVRWSAWYPCDPDASAPTLHNLGPFQVGALFPGARLAPDIERYPVVLLSHGTGGSPESLGWLARHLAAEGFIVLGAHHHGNTGSEPYRAEGFLCWWERAADLSFLLDTLEASGPFAGRLDFQNVRALGFSLGCHTALSLLGARGTMARFAAWASDHEKEYPQFASGPPEFPGLAEKAAGLAESSAPFRKSWERQGADFTDRRVTAAVTIAPPPPVRAFDRATLAAITAPVLMLTGEADREAPTHAGAQWLKEANARFSHVSLGQNAGHYSFLGLAVGPAEGEMAFLFEDLPGMDRAALHAETARLVVAACAEPGP
ncbi:MAG: dienelactone hydrolase [Pseudomonadota bacterium]